MTSQWNIPTVAYGTTKTILSNKEIYDTYSRLVGLTANFGFVSLQVANFENWMRICILIINQPGNHFEYALDAINRKETNITIMNYDFTREKLASSLQIMKQSCRGKVTIFVQYCVLYCVPPVNVRVTDKI